MTVPKAVQAKTVLGEGAGGRVPHFQKVSFASTVRFPSDPSHKNFLALFSKDLECSNGMLTYWHVNLKAQGVLAELTLWKYQAFEESRCFVFVFSAVFPFISS